MGQTAEELKLIISGDAAGGAGALKDIESGFKRVETSLTQTTASSNKFLDALGKGAPTLNATQSSLAAVGRNLNVAGTNAVTAGPKFASLEGVVGKLGTTLGLSEGLIGSLAAGLVSLAGPAAMGLLITNTLHAADRLTALHDKTGITAEALQVFEAVAAESGNSLEQVTIAINQMQRRLAGDNDSARHAVNGLGLDFDRLKVLSPEEQFRVIAERIRDIKDPAQQVNAAMEIFGRQGAQILPTIKTNFDEIANSMPRMSNEAVATLNEVADAIDRLWRRTKAVVGNATAAAITAVVTYGSGDERTRALRLAMSDEPDAAAAGARMLAEIEARDLDAEIKKTAAGLKSTVAGRAASGLAVPDAHDLKDIFEDLNEKAKATRDAFKKATEEFAKMSKEALGVVLTWERALALMHGVSSGNLGLPVLESQLFTGTGRNPVSPNLVTVPGGFRFGANTGSGDFSGVTTGPVRIGNRTFDTGGLDLGSLLRDQLGPTVLGAIQGGGSVGGSVGGLLGGSVASSFGGVASKAMSSVLGKTIGGAIGSVIPGLGTILGSLAGGLLGKLGGVFGGTKGRDEVRDYAASQGGFEALHAKLRDLGAAGETLWMKLTQGVGRNSPEQAAAAIAAVTTALDKHGKQVEIARGLQESLTARMAHLTDVSPQLQAALSAVYDAKNPTDYATAAKIVSGILDEQDAKQNHLAQTMDKYGLAWTEMGQKAKDAHAAETAAGLVAEFDELAGAGIDVNHIMEKMGPNVNAFVHEAQTAGVEIPESFRRIIQIGIDAGQVTDENGRKVTDLKELNLKFGETMLEVQKKSTDAMERLIDALDRISGGFGTARQKAIDAGGGIAASMRTAQDSVEDVADAVDALNFGHSPGGLKEIPLLMAAGRRAAAAFSVDTIDSMTRAKASIDAIAGVPIDVYGGRSMGSRLDQAGIGGRAVIVNVHVEGNVLTERELMDAVSQHLADTFMQVGGGLPVNH